jgi:hypothetical protein
MFTDCAPRLVLIRDPNQSIRSPCQLFNLLLPLVEAELTSLTLLPCLSLPGAASGLRVGI